MIIDQAFNNEPATVKDHGFALSPDTKSPYVWFTFVFDNLRGDNDAEVTVKAYIYLTEKALDYSLEKLAALGWHGSNICELDPSEAEAFPFKGAKAFLTGEMETYEGKTRPKVLFINSGEFPDQAVDKATVSLLDKKLKGKIAAYRAKNGSTVKAKPPAENKQPVAASSSGPVFNQKDPDDIPF